MRFASIGLCIALLCIPFGFVGAVERDKLLTEPGVYVTFAVFQLNDDWRKLDAAGKHAAADALRRIFQQHVDRLAADAYFSTGLADRADFFLRLHATELAHNQAFLADLMTSPLGVYLTRLGTFHGITKKLNYAPGLPDEMKAALKAPADVGSNPYAIMVPIRKDAAWWLQDRETRQKQIQEHTQVTLAYLKTVKRKLYHSSGLDDFDFLTYFETAKMEDFHNLMLALQTVEEYRHITRSGHPILIGTAMPLDALLKTLTK